MAQEEASNLAAWQLLGGGAEGTWLLTDTQLEAQCTAHSLPLDGNRDARLARLAAALRPGGEARPRVTRQSLPDNLHALSLAQLRSLCIAHAIDLPADCGVDDAIELIEARVREDELPRAIRSSAPSAWGCAALAIRDSGE